MAKGMYEVPSGAHAAVRMMRDARRQRAREGLSGEVAFGSRINLGGIYLEARREEDGGLHLVLYDSATPDLVIDVMAQTATQRTLTMHHSGASSNGDARADASLLVPSDISLGGLFVNAGTGPAGDMVVTLQYALDLTSPVWNDLTDARVVLPAGETAGSVEFSPIRMDAQSLVNFSVSNGGGAANIVVQAVGV